MTHCQTVDEGPNQEQPAPPAPPTPEAEPETLPLEELTRRLRAVDPSVVLAPAYVLRRVIRHERQVGGMALGVPHFKSFVVPRERLLELATLDLDLDLPPDYELAEQVILLKRPDHDMLTHTPPSELLVVYWRLLFHARVHQVLDARWERGELSVPLLKERLMLLGEAGFTEARGVLDQEGYLLPPGDQRTSYTELAALFLELHHFAHTLLPWYFPSFEDPQEVLEVVQLDVDSAALFAETRLEGAPDPTPPAEVTSEEPQADYKRLVKEATDLSSSGNRVRAAILRVRAARVAIADLEESTREQGIDDLFALVDRMARLVPLTGEQVLRWRRVLPPLLEKSDQGFWPQEARLLYDLQKACDDAEKQEYQVKPTLWRESGHLIHKVPTQVEILIRRSLATAFSRLPAVRLYDNDRQELRALLREAMATCENRLRGRLRPLILAALDEGGFDGEGVPELVARDKIVEELLDLIVERGFLGFADVRDVLSRNHLKLPDLAGPGELVQGDPLLRLNLALRRRLENIYRAGEVYRRSLQRFSSLFSGTVPGRLLVLYLFLPFTAAAAILSVGEHLLHFLGDLVMPPDPVKGVAGFHPTLFDWIPVTVLGIYLALAIRFPRVRRLTRRFFKELGRGLKLVCYDLPKQVIDSPFVQRLIDHPAVIAVRRYLFYPARVTFLLWVIWYLTKVPIYEVWWANLLIFLGAVVILNTRRWHLAQEAAGGAMMTGWHLLRVDFLQGLLRLILAFFKRIGEIVEMVLYEVDEALRFRSGDPKVATGFKALLLPVWGPLSYGLRFTYDTCIEPRINPIKYLSVVIVADKLFIPVTIPIVSFFAGILDFLGGFLANTIAIFVSYAIPAIVGFLVWELKENWKLYLGNRKPSLSPVPITRRGETLPNLLEPAVHSDTFPALYARLRAAERKAHETMDWTKSRKHRAALDDVLTAIGKFVERDFLDLLARSRGWDTPPLEVAEVQAGLTNVTVVLRDPTQRPEAGHTARWRQATAGADGMVRIEFELDSGWLQVRCAGRHWFESLNEPQQRAFTIALLGLYKMAGVDLVREQIAACLSEHPTLAPANEVEEQGIKLWPAGHYEAAAIYPLEDARDGDLIQPQPLDGIKVELPALPADQLSLQHVPITWDDWMTAWAAERSGSPSELMKRIHLDPA